MVKQTFLPQRIETKATLGMSVCRELGHPTVEPFAILLRPRSEPRGGQVGRGRPTTAPVSRAPAALVNAQLGPLPSQGPDFCHLTRSSSPKDEDPLGAALWTGPPLVTAPSLA